MMKKISSKIEYIHCGRAFTLIELLVVISVIALLIAILLPALSASRELAKSINCLSNLRQQGVGVAIYVHDNGGYLPPNTQSDVYVPYVLHANSNPETFYNLGFLHREGYIDTAEAYYCPSMENPAFMLETEGNYWWDYYPLGHSNRTAPNWFTRGSYYYYTRDTSKWGSGSSSIRREDDLMSGQAVLSDNIFDLSNYAHQDRKGFNVMYADGAASMWSDSKGDLQSIAPGGGFLTNSFQVINLFELFDN